ncbi:tryptophan synthase, beta subunit [Thermanaerovibrio velox DSM 12556]|uniref:Tryptophan synthase beta chain n=1 Tax=Thermanaerovibrio velox DSM 12556 TaxID=926567 RepID=H0UN08_9BACT|nr:tryptophan synthase subunit beta [Thermanaerovibrio velox]EHM09287.1 tryptophan synthase, beta subunit [Thermanaerovibrio velox DSM 12556]
MRQMSQAEGKRVLGDGYFGRYGGAFVDSAVAERLSELEGAFQEALGDPEFEREYRELLRHYVGRPSALTRCLNLSSLSPKGARMYLKREDLNHTGAHKINNALGQGLLARRMGKDRIIAETGAGMHGTACATVAALLGLQCTVFMGEQDVKKQAPNVARMRALGAQVVSVSQGAGTLKEAVDAALDRYVSDPGAFYLLGSVVGPHPYPTMVRHFQSIIGEEAREQFLQVEGCLPSHAIACVGGGSNAMGLFSGFLGDPSVQLVAVEPAGLGLHTDKHAASLLKGREAVIHGFRTYVLTDHDGSPAEVHSVSSGLDYPGVGPELAHLKDLGRIRCESVTDREALEAFLTLSRTEGIIPALESSHAVAYALKLLPTLNEDQAILVNLSGRGDKDLDTVMRELRL